MIKIHVAIVGLGGVGGYFGYKMALKYLNHETVAIDFVARDETYDILRQDGLTLISPEHPENIKVNPANLYDNVKSIYDTDYLLLCVKEYDLEKICNTLKDNLNPATVVIPLMNGVDIYDRIRCILSNNTVLPTCLYVASHIASKGVIVHKGNPGKIIIGNDPSSKKDNIDRFVYLVKNAEIEIEYKENSLPDIWTKFMFIAPFGLITANYDVPMGEVIHNKKLRGRACLIMEEIEAIAHKLNVLLPSDIREATFRKAATFPFDTPTSLQLDVNLSKINTELALFAGAIIKNGQLTHTHTLETSKIYAEILEKINNREIK